MWGARTVRFAIAVLAVTALSHRFGLIDTNTGMTLLGFSWAGAAAALLLGFAALGAVWRLGLEGVGQALFAVVFSVAVLAIPLYYLGVMLKTPPLVDVSTDIDDPPPFQALAVQRPAAANPAAFQRGPKALLQLAAYPDVRTFRVAAGVEDTFDAVLSVAHEMDWTIIVENPPPDGDSQGNVEAVASTLLMGFKDDVVVRVRPDASGSRVDMRSQSRFGYRDFGANANRIRAFLQALREKISPTAGGEK